MATLTQFQADLATNLLEKVNPDLYFKGEEIFLDEKIDLTSHQGDDFLFLAIGSRKNLYRVSIDLSSYEGKRVPSLRSRTSCTCPYFGDFFKCKHVAAALYFLETREIEDTQLDLWNNKLSKSSISKSKPKAADEIPTQFTISGDELGKIPSFLPELNGKLLRYSIQKVDFLPHALCYSMYLNGYFAELRASYDSKKLMFKVDFPKSNKQLIPDIFKFFKERFSEKYQDQRFLTAELRTETKKEILQNQGLLSAVNDIEKAINFELQGDLIRVFYSGELTGFKEVGEFNRNLSDLLPKAKEESYIEHLKESELAKDIGKYNLGFVLNYTHYNSIMFLIPIIGKGKKQDPAGLYTKIEVMDNPKDYRLAKKEGMAELFQLMHSFNRLGESSDEYEFWKSGVSFFRKTAEIPVFFMGGFSLIPTKISPKELTNRISPVETSAKIKLLESEFFYELTLVISYGGNDYHFMPGPNAIRYKTGFGFFDDKLLFFNDFRQAEGVGNLIKILPFKFSKQQLNQVINEVIQPLTAFIPFEDLHNHLRWEIKEGLLQEELYITELGGLVAFVPKMIYGDLSINPLDPSILLNPETGDPVERNREAEQNFLDFVSDLHPHFDKLLPKFLFSISALDFADGNWFLEAFEKLKSRGVKTYGLENIKIKRYSPFSAKVHTQFSSSQDWFGINTDVSFGDETIPLSRLRKSWESGEKFIQLGDGSLGKIPEEWMRKMIRILRSGEVSGEVVRLSKVHFMLLEDWEETVEFALIQEEVDSKKAKMDEFSGIHEVTVPQKLKAELRPYQKTGLNWLKFLRDFQWGGILADDMGLGKTIQVITLICQLEEENPNLKVLIVAPTTLLFNWKKELEKFSPHLDYFIHHGFRYDTIEELTKHQLVLTSYGLVINDLELLQKIDWDLIIADESQAIKNTSSLRYKAMVRLKGKQKIALTGTPIENGIHELYAQMNFTNPGFFKTFNHFTEHFLTPIKKGEGDVVQSLKKQITPFVLRRTKKEVLTELPDKIEELLFCEMGAVQRAVYESKREEYRNFLLQKFDESGPDQSKMFVLEGLTRLRQICDSPQLTGDTGTQSSAKIELLKEHILEKTGNHKILVFSQFVKMLDLIRGQLDQSKIPYSYLDGQTSLPERERQVQRFQENESIRVFLISLKAGGTGLNLTAADYVYIVDPWWNPAVENQAIDRCYRMGQEKHVVAYRMICQNSIEEKIMELQSAKRQLAQDVIGEGEGILASLDREGMLELFS